MQRLISRSLLAAAAAAALLLAQQPRREDPPPVRLPDGRLQSEEILKADHAANLRDAGQLIRLAEELKSELEKHDRHVLSLAAVKKTEEIEKLAKKIRSRMKRF